MGNKFEIGEDDKIFKVKGDGTIVRVDEPDNSGTKLNATDKALLTIIRIGANKQSILAARNAQKKCFKIYRKQTGRVDYKEHVQQLQLDYYPNEFKKSELGRKYKNQIWWFPLLAIVLLYGLGWFFGGLFYGLILLAIGGFGLYQTIKSLKKIKEQFEKIKEQ